MLETNASSKTFDSYQAQWTDEREDIREAHCLKTDFDFKEANRAVQKNLHKLGEGQESSAGGQDNFDDWGDSAKPKQ